MHNSLFTKKNWILIGISVVLLAIGYILLGQGPVDNPLSMNVAPVILVAVYCLLIPYAIMVRDKKTEAPKEHEQQKKQGV